MRERLEYHVLRSAGLESIGAEDSIATVERRATAIGWAWLPAICVCSAALEDSYYVVAIV